MVQFSEWIGVWDQTHKVMKHQLAGVTAHERLYKFLLEFSKLQSDALSAQKKLCDRFIIDVQKYFDSDNTYGNAMNNFLRVIQMIIDTENLIPTSFEMNANGDTKKAIENEKKRFKEWKHDRDKLQSEMKSQTRIIDDEIKLYQNKFREMMKSAEDYKRIDHDASNSHLDVAKARTVAKVKSDDFVHARGVYKAALNQYNLYRTDYYNRTLPLWADVGYRLGKDRYNSTVNLFTALHSRVCVTAERMNMVCGELLSVCNNFNIDQDTEDFLSNIKSGLPYPSDIPFVDLAASCSDQFTSNRTQELNADDSPVYAAPLCWPSNFYPSVSVADLAALETVGISKETVQDGQIYAGTGSLYSTFSNVVQTGFGSSVRRSSQSSNHPQPILPSPTHGPGLLRRFFSRRSRSVANIKSAQVSGAGEADLNRDLQAEPISESAVLGRKFVVNAQNDLLDSSDFSDTSLELDDKEAVDPSAQQSTGAYAATAILFASERSKQTNGRFSGTKLKSLSLHDTQNPHAPLAKPEGDNVTVGVYQESMKRNTEYETSSIPVRTIHSTPTANADDLRSSPARQSRPTDLPINGDRKEQFPANNGTTASKSPIHRAPSKPRRPPPLTSIRGVGKSFDSNSARYEQNHGHSPVKGTQHPRHVSAQILSVHDDRKHDNQISADTNQRLYYPHQVRSEKVPEETVIVVGSCTAIYPFAAEGFDPCYLPFEAGEQFYILAPSVSEDTSEWIRVIRYESLESGYVPTAFMEQEHYAQSMILPINNHHHQQQQEDGRRKSIAESPSSPYRPTAQRSQPAYSHLPRLHKSPLHSRLVGLSRDTEL